MCGKIPQMIQQFGEEFELNIIKQHLARDIKKRNHEFTNYCTKAREPFKPLFLSFQSIEKTFGSTLNS